MKLSKQIKLMAVPVAILGSVLIGVETAQAGEVQKASSQPVEATVGKLSEGSVQKPSSQPVEATVDKLPGRQLSSTEYSEANGLKGYGSRG